MQIVQLHDDFRSSDGIRTNQCSISKYAKDEPGYGFFSAISPKHVRLSYADENQESRISGDIPGHLVQSISVTMPKKIEQLPGSYTSINSRLSGSPPLWITHTSDRSHNNIYVNNARVLLRESNKEGQIPTPKEPIIQILHKIDEVLIPTKSSSGTVSNPSAWEFLENHESISQGSHRVRSFRQRVKENNKEEIFSREGAHTFFIPVDEGFVKSRASLVDDKVIDGHVIPKQVLFTTPTRKDVPFQTLANGDNTIRVVVSFTQEQRENSIINYVKSHTILSDSKHSAGVVLTEIVQANIPVKNGVIHLINKPLMIVDGTLLEVLKEHLDYICRVGKVQKMENIVDRASDVDLHLESLPYDPSYRQYDPLSSYLAHEQDGAVLSRFYNSLESLGPAGQDFLRTIEKSQDITLFAPCNTALESGHMVLDGIMADKQRFLEILKLHLVVDNRLYMEKVMDLNQQQIFQAPTLAKGKIYFNVMRNGNNRTMTVEGGGVNATVIQPDLAAKNGVIHIIDKVLGLPYKTVLDKLISDPMLSDTLKLGSMEGFNNQLNDTSKKFTYFVPRNEAWQTARVALPSAIKQLFMMDFSNHATVTLQRHLVVSHDEVFTMEKIKQMADNNSNQNFGGGNNIYRAPSTIQLPTVRGSLKLWVEEKNDNTFVIHWEDILIPVFRPNVECTNGIIHVIDLPFLKEGDVSVGGSAILKPSAIMALVISTLFVKFVLQ